MKKLFTILAISFLIVNMAYAGSKENCGCGLGSMILGDQEPLAMQLVITLLNGTCGNQTFGISSGTLGCEKPKTLVLNERLDKFVADNMDSIAVDIAAGQGESLDALADLAEISIEKRPDLYNAFQKNFGQIYSSAQSSHKEVVVQLVNIIEQI
ncbi:conserved hypothetical protein, secreted [Candidatus Magnetomorum sp. HK-1]|nr:conserved hypothetical protein, secreted [Candidatus Magnetomorum sp. HK-1]